MSAAPELPKGPLSGLRVLDFTWKAVGPWAPRLLTHFGAEVIHIERADSWDDHRFTLRRSNVIEGPIAEWTQAESDGAFFGGPGSEETRGKYYAQPYWSTLTSGKLGISLNTRHPEGLELAEKLVAISNAVVENFSAEVMNNWGLGWDRLHEINPRLVYLSTSGFGHSGEWSGYRSYGPTAAAQGGLTLTSGLPGREPAGWGYSHMDIMGGWMGGLALLMGLLQAKQTGRGFYIDYAVSEGTMALLGQYMLDFQVNGRRTRRPDFPPGNRAAFPAVAPHNTYRCSGHDRAGQDWWVFIACETQTQFESLCNVMQQPELLLDSRFATMEGRFANQDALDAVIGIWTRPRRRYDIMRMCQRVGVIAAVVQSAEDRVEYDPQLQHREVYQVTEHPEVGAFQYESYPVKMSRTPIFLKGRAPLMREHNRYVYGELLGLSEERIAMLEAEQVI
jgi:crotonobetainyl-CoA:carnitine CoA-transferase CaiB-like acyl-CoA transferase